MNIALIGYGRMGHEIESIALQRGHTIGLIIDIDNKSDLNRKNLEKIDVAIEFSFPAAAVENITHCLENKVPVVSGTTGWNDSYNDICELCRKNDTSFIHSTNYSIGVNLLFTLNKQLAGLMDRFNNYSVSIEEIHHTKKLDAPSGTAITLSDGIREGHSGYKGWSLGNADSVDKVPITAVREGLVIGTHTVTWDSEIDKISLRHEAKDRRGLAMGAVVAAEFIQNKKGIFNMSDVIGL
jgi:4-hydroxy-tetrahydrodipicolinate reductase